MATIRTKLAGKIFGRLTVTETYRQIQGLGTFWICNCRCGNTVERHVITLTRGNADVKRCGKCYDETKYYSEYRTWCSMINRCYSVDNEWYHRYGGRGITISKSWRDDFLNFLEDMGRRPPNLSLERIDNDGNYEKTNCKWATAFEQTLNRDVTKFHRL